ncbi:MAG: HIT family protein [Pseudomonadota bacterium]
MNDFVLDPTLEADTLAVADIGLCAVRLMNDARFPWLILVPKRANLREIHELTPLDQTILTFEISQMSKLLQQATGAQKMNVAALGNQVAQLHVHVIARFEDDPAWPNPVWGSGEALTYEPEKAQWLVASLVSQI